MKKGQSPDFRTPEVGISVQGVNKALKFMLLQIFSRSSALNIVFLLCLQAEKYCID